MRMLTKEARKPVDLFKAKIHFFCPFKLFLDLALDF